MKEYKEGNHLKWDPDAVIKEYYATFPDLPTSPPENEPVCPSAEDDEANMGDNADDPPVAWF